MARVHLLLAGHAVERPQADVQRRLVHEESALVADGIAVAPWCSVVCGGESDPATVLARWAPGLNGHLAVVPREVVNA